MYKFSQSIKSSSNIKNSISKCFDFKINQPATSQRQNTFTEKIILNSNKKRNKNDKQQNKFYIPMNQSNNLKTSVSQLQQNYISFKIKPSNNFSLSDIKISAHKISPLKQNNSSNNNYIEHQKSLQSSQIHNENQKNKFKNSFEEQQSLNPFKKNSYLKKTYIKSIDQKQQKKVCQIKFQNFYQTNQSQRQQFDQLRTPQLRKCSNSKSSIELSYTYENQTSKTSFPLHQLHNNKTSKTQFSLNKNNNSSYSTSFGNSTYNLNTHSSHKNNRKQQISYQSKKISLQNKNQQLIISHSNKKQQNKLYGKQIQIKQTFAKPHFKQSHKKKNLDLNFKQQDSIVNDNFKQYDIFTPCKNLQQQFQRQQKLYNQQRINQQENKQNSQKQFAYFLNEFDSFSRTNKRTKNIYQKLQNQQYNISTRRQNYQSTNNAKLFSNIKNKNNQSNSKLLNSKQKSQQDGFFFLTIPHQKTTQKKKQNQEEFETKISNTNQISRKVSNSSSKFQKQYSKHNNTIKITNKNENYQQKQKNHLQSRQYSSQQQQQVHEGLQQHKNHNKIKQFCFSLSSINLNNDEINYKNLFSNSNQNINYFNSNNPWNSKQQNQFTSKSKKIHIKHLVQQFIQQLQYLDDGSLNQKVVNQLEDVLESIVFKQQKFKKNQQELINRKITHKEQYQNLTRIMDIKNQKNNNLEEFNNLYKKQLPLGNEIIDKPLIQKEIIAKKQPSSRWNYLDIYNQKPYQNLLKQNNNHDNQNKNLSNNLYLIKDKYLDTSVKKWQKHSYEGQNNLSPKNVLTQRKISRNQQIKNQKLSKLSQQMNYPYSYANKYNKDEETKKSQIPIAKNTFSVYQYKQKNINKSHTIQSFSNQRVSNNKSSQGQSTGTTIINSGRDIKSSVMTIYKPNLPNFPQRKIFESKEKQKQNLNRNTSFVRQNNKKALFQSPLNINPKSSVYMNNKKSKGHRQILKTQVSRQKQWRVY